MASLIWLITGRCNLSCPHCYASGLSSLEEMGTEECLRVVREAAELGVDYIGFAGGEPLLRRDLIRIMQEAWDLGVEVGLVTNGTLLNEEVSARLYRMEARVALSFDGPRRVHEARRGPGSWRAVSRASEALRRVGFDVRLVTAVGRDNFRMAREALEDASSLGAVRVSLIPVMPSGRGRRLAVGPGEWMEAALTAWEAQDDVGVSVGFWCVPFMSRYLPVRAWPCRLSDTLDLDPAGGVLLCDVLDVRLSTVRGRSLMEAWEEAESHPLSVRVSSPELRGPCAECPVREECLGGCYARSMLAGRGPDGPDPLCPAGGSIYFGGV